MIDRERSQYTMLGLRLREIREHHGMTQEQLARRLEVSARAVSRWETGNTRRDIELRFVNWQRIASVFKVGLDQVHHPVGAPILHVRGHKAKRRGEITIYEPLKFSEAQHILQCSPRALTALIKHGDIKIVLVQMIKARSLYRYIAKRGGYNGG